MDFLHLGSSLSLRQFARCGSTLSTWGGARFGSVYQLSVVDFTHLGSALAIRSFGRLGSGLSVMDYLHLGSSLSPACCKLLALESALRKNTQLLLLGAVEM